MLVTVVFWSGKTEAWRDVVRVDRLGTHTFEIVVRQQHNDVRVRITDVKVFLAGCMMEG